MVGLGESGLERHEEAGVVDVDGRRRDAEVDRTWPVSPKPGMRSSSAVDLVPVHRDHRVAQLLGGVATPRRGASRTRRCARAARAMPPLRLAEVDELGRDVRDVRVAHRDRSLVVAQVVVAIRQAEPALPDVDEVGAASSKSAVTSSECSDADAVPLQIADRPPMRPRSTRSRRCASRNGRERGDAGRRDRGLVHAPPRSSRPTRRPGVRVARRRGGGRRAAGGAVPGCAR